MLLELNCFCATWCLCNLLTKRETHTRARARGETDREMIDLEQQKKLGDETENNGDEGGEGRRGELLRVLTTVVII